MKKSFPLYVLVGYGLLFLLAIILRFNHLGEPLLNEKEAAIALQAVNGGTDFSTAIPGSHGLTAILNIVFFALGRSEFTARLVPAIFGCLIIFVPFLFHKYIGKETALILSVLLMFEPGLAAYSRMVDGAIISICGLLFAAGFFINRKFVLAGIATGFALLGSPIIWPGLIAIGLAFWLSVRKKSENESIGGEWKTFFQLDKNELTNLLIALGLTVFIVGSSFMTRLIGVASPILNLTAYFRGWFLISGVSAFLMLFSFVLYQPFSLMFGLFEGFRSMRSGSRLNTYFMWWFFLSVLLAIIYPSKGMDSILFSIIPILFLSARCIWRIIRSSEKPDIPAYGQMVLVILLVAFSWMNFVVLKFPIEGQDAWLRAAAAGGALALLIIASILIRMGWPPKQAGTGLWMGLAVLIGIFAFSTSWRSAGLGLHPETELWNYDGVTSEMDLLKSTAGDLSEWNINSREGINIVILDYPSAALKWGLLNFTSVNEDQTLPSLSNPAIVITRAEQEPALAEAYRGQDFALIRKTSWSLIMPHEWIRWYAFRELPTETEQVILWARTDLFPGAAKTAPATIDPIQ
jgi:hypothetical protein